MEQKLKQKEKYELSNRKILVVLSLIVLTAFALFLNTACSFSKETVQTSSNDSSAAPQSATIEPSSTPKETPQPTPTPIPTPEYVPELSLEEERALLGVEIQDLETVGKPVNIDVILYSQNSETDKDATRIAWTVVGSDTSDLWTIYNVWDRKKMYTINMSESKFKEAIKKAVPANKKLEDSKIIDSTGIYALEQFYEKHGIVFELPEEYKKIMSLCDEESNAILMEYSLSMSDLMNLYIKCTPKVYRTSWKDFDERMVVETTAP